MAAALVSIATVGAIPIVVAIDAAESQMTQRVMHRIDGNMRVAWHLIHDLGPNARIDGGSLYAGATSLNGNARLVDDVTAMVGGVATVFQGDVRIATNVRNTDGSPAIGTHLASGLVYDTVVRRHRAFRGRADILGTDYYAAYDPILNAAGQQIGILFVGIKASDVMAGMAHLRLAIGAVSVGAMLLVGLIFFGIGRALTRRLVERERALRETNARLAIALDSMANGLCLWNAERRLVITNHRVIELLGIPADRLQPGMDFRSFVALRHARGHYGDRDPDAVYAERIANLSRAEPAPHLEHFSDGRVISVVLKLIEGGGWLTTYEDVTERHRAGSQIAHLAHHDALTGLANRTLFNERIASALEYDHAFALLCIDLDGFKSVNDTLGHPAGDALLTLVAARLQQCCRAGDTVARLGGDEFAIVLAPLPRAEDASSVAERILHAVASPYGLEGTQAEIGVSVGVVISNPGDRETETLLKHADIALYQAKSAGGNTFRVFDAGMDDARRVRRALEGELRRALAEEEFVLFYQPQINVQSRAVCGFEALIRWRHPSRGLLGPAEFVPAAEAAGLIAPIGAWVLHQACADAARWACGWPDQVRVAVNLSAMQFRDPDLVATVHAALLLAGLPPQALELEITETLALHEVDSAAAVLAELRALGISIALDDFGTGYSSLSFVRSFPLDRIKIDRSFVDGIGTRADSVAIIRSVGGLAHSLGIATVAEGVETEAQLRWLADEGCDEVQGYLFSRPRPVEAVPAMLRYRDARQIAQHAAAD